LRPSSAGMVFSLLVSAWAAYETPDGAVGADQMSTETAVLAMGCFWCAEADFEKKGCDGILDVRSGYTGGEVVHPTYYESFDLEHYEAIEVRFDTTKVSFQQVLHLFWKNVDPFAVAGQFCDMMSPNYDAAIFYTSDKQKREAENSKTAAAMALGVTVDKLNVAILPAAPFYCAEEYHQDFWSSCHTDCTATYGGCCRTRYTLYRNGCRRDQRLAEVWGGINLNLPALGNCTEVANTADRGDTGACPFCGGRRTPGICAVGEEPPSTTRGPSPAPGAVGPSPSPSGQVTTTPLTGTNAIGGAGGLSIGAALLLAFSSR